MSAAVEHVTSVTSSVGNASKDGTLAAPNGRRTSKGGISSSATSIASSDNPGDGASNYDGSLDKFKSRGSEDGQSEGSSHRRKMSRLFRKGRRRRKSDAQDDVSQVDSTEHIPPLPDSRPQFREPLFQSEESLGLHKSVPSSLLTEDSDDEKP